MRVEFDGAWEGVGAKEVSLSEAGASGGRV